MAHDHAAFSVVVHTELNVDEAELAVLEVFFLDDDDDDEEGSPSYFLFKNRDFKY